MYILPKIGLVVMRCLAYWHDNNINISILVSVIIDKKEMFCSICKCINISYLYIICIDSTKKKVYFTFFFFHIILIDIYVYHKSTTFFFFCAIPKEQDGMGCQGGGVNLLLFNIQHY